MEARWGRLAAVIAIVLLVLYLLVTPAPTEDVAFGIMMDAGSTGSRIHVYKFRFESKLDSLVLDSELFLHSEPGLSSFKDDPKAGAQSLVPLLEGAMKSIPDSQRAATPINLKATAGLRLIDKAKADALLFEVRSLLKKYPFYYDQSDAVEIMTGDDEGLFGWVTINYLRNALHQPPEKTAAVLDLGGGSTQIALSVSPGDRSSNAPLKATVVMGYEHHMFVYSHLKYGLMAGRMEMLVHGLAENDPRRHGSVRLDHPCLHRDVEISYEYGSESVIARGGLDSSFEACEKIAIAVMKSPTGSFSLAGAQPAPQPGQPVFAMSYYFDRAVDAGLVSPSALHADLKPEHYRDAAKKACALSPEKLREQFPNVSTKTAPYLCMDLCFIEALLEHGFGLKPQAPIVLAKKLEFNGALVETAWSLGASLAEISETRQQL